MRKQRSLFSLAAMLVMALGTSHSISADEIAAPDTVQPWLTEEFDPAMRDDGTVGDGDMRKRSTGLCIAHFSPRDSKRYYSCDYPTSESCIDSRMNEVAKVGNERRWICPGPNPS